MPFPNKLTEIKSELERYHTAFCALKHERVVEVNTDDSQTSFKRYGFCNKAERKYRLGCAHTMANQQFCAIVLSMQPHLPNAEALAKAFDELFVKVYMMDVAKGALEKQLALALLAKNDGLITEAKAAIAQVVATHNQLIKAIEKLRYELMETLQVTGATAQPL